MVLKTDLLDYVDLRSGFSSGTVAINLVDADLPVSALSCGWTSDGQVTYSQVNVTIESLQSKTEMCIEDLRAKYTSAFMNAGTGNDFLPFEQVISESYTDKLRKYNEGFLINGFGTTTGLKAQITSANGANLQAGTPAAWDATNAYEQALDLYDAIDESVKDRDDLIMVVSPDAYRALVRALVAQNLYHFNSVESNDIMILPGTNVTVVKSSAYLVAVLSILYDEAADVMKFRAAWRLGVGVGEVNVFATNDMA